MTRFAVFIMTAAASVVAFVRAFSDPAPVPPSPSGGGPSNPAAPKPRATYGDVLKNFALTLSLALLALFVAIIINELRDRSITIEAFSVSESLEKKGYTGRAVALRFMDRVAEISSGEEADLPRKLYTADWQHDSLELQVPELQTNLRSIVSALRRVLPAPEQTAFTCELADGSFTDSIIVSARLTHRGRFVKEYPLAELDTAIADLATYYYRETQPIVLASHMCRVNGAADPQCLDVIQDILNGPPRIDTFYAYDLLGRLHGRNTVVDLDRAIDYFTSAIEFDCPGCAIQPAVRAVALSNRGGAYMDKNALTHEASLVAQAIADYKEAVRLSPDDAQILTNLGILLASQKEREEAIRNLDAAVKAEPEFAGAYLERGRLLVESGRLDEAFTDLSRVIQLRPAFAEAYVRRSEIYRRRRKVLNAERDTRLAREIENLRANLVPGAATPDGGLRVE